ncbi:MAG: M48 family metallopeptidase, partial [Leptospiraceae bacterium]|nr:M48 family metallopeptidase [Leptospiraceae bacterium]
MEDLTTRSGQTTAEFEGAAFIEDGSRIAGMLRVLPGTLEFKPNVADQHPIQLPLDNLEISAGGNQNRLIYFKNPARTGISLYTTDRSILKEQSLQRPALQPAIKKIVGGHRRVKAGYWTLLIATLGILAAAWMGRGLVFQAAIDSIPPEAEIKLGELVEKNLTSTMSVIKDPVVNEGVETITRPLTEVAESPLPFTFHVVQHQEVNAFAIPGGSIFIHSALIEKANSAEEIAGVMAHEMAHVIHRHGMQLMVRRIGLYVLIGAMFGDTQGLIAALADQGGFLLSQKFSRDFERQADETGFKILVAANIDPSGMLTFFERIKEIQEEQMSDTEQSAMAIMGTHPATEERIE